MRTRSALVFSVLTALVAVSAPVDEGCAALQQAVPYLPTADEQACVLAEVEHGHLDPRADAAKCGIVESALEFVEHLIMAGSKERARRLAAAAFDGGGQ